MSDFDAGILLGFFLGVFAFAFCYGVFQIAAAQNNRPNWLKHPWEDDA